MQHGLRCWERQSDGTEYKKTLRRPGLCLGPSLMSLQRSRKPPIWWGGAGCPLHKNPIHRSPNPHSKISSDALGNWLSFVISRYAVRQNIDNGKKNTV